MKVIEVVFTDSTSNSEWESYGVLREWAKNGAMGEKTHFVGFMIDETEEYYLLSPFIAETTEEAKYTFRIPKIAVISFKERK